MRISIIGYGEVGKTLAEDLRAQQHSVSAYDVKLGTPAGAAQREHAARFGVHLAASHADAVRGSEWVGNERVGSEPVGTELVISAVTASQTLAVAEACAGQIGNAYFLDFNSASPAAKQDAARCIDAAGGRYVEGAVMTLISGYRIKVPLLLGGVHAQALLPVITALGFCAKVASSTLGVASATKLCRSVVMKGLEVMLIESLTAARHYGVEDAVIASLCETHPGVDWQQQASYAFQRVIEHGGRRSEEMREAARTVQDAGLVPLSAAGTAARDSWITEQAEAGVFGTRGEPGFARSSDWRLEADRRLASLRGAARDSTP